MKENLEKKLKNRHIQMIAIGGAIGTGFFLGSANAIRMTGPSITLAYMLGGLIIYGVMRALGEITVHNPSSGSFVEYAHRYLGKGAGFVAGWNAWILFTIACMLEVTAAATLLDHWILIPHWQTCLALLLLFGTVNLVGVKYFGESEFWFAGIKVAVILFMIITGTYLIFSDHDVKQNAIDNIQNYQQANIFFSEGIGGFLNALSIVVLSFCGAEFVCVAASEAENPRKSIPTAINGVIVRIILFYVLTLSVIMLMYPFSKIGTNTNPFTDVFTKLGFHYAADIINFVAITATLSALNSCIYVASRFLYRLSLNKQAPESFSKIKNHLPANAVLFTVAFTFLAVIANYVFPATILGYLFELIPVTIIINWYIILLTHLNFRAKMNEQGRNLSYKLRGYPAVNIAIMGALFIVLVTMVREPSSATGVFLAPLWLMILSIMYTLINKKHKKLANET